MNTNPSEGQELFLSAGVARTLEAITTPDNRSAFCERAIQRELCWAPSRVIEAVEGNLDNIGKPVGRPRKVAVS
jgi:hypothetical protein